MLPKLKVTLTPTPVQLDEALEEPDALVSLGLEGSEFGMAIKSNGETALQLRVTDLRVTDARLNSRSTPHALLTNPIQI